MKNLFLYLIIFVFSISLAYASMWDKLTPDLESRIENAKKSEKIPVILYPQIPERYKMREEMAKGHNKVFLDLLREISSMTQKPILQYLKRFGGEVSDIESFWVTDVITLKATPDAILALTDRKDIRRIELQPENHILYAKGSGYGKFTGLSPEWNIKKIGADSVWDMGYTGDGIIIGEIDTGVDTSHPALQGKWTGHWFDAVHNLPHPYDNHSHGTHVMGIMIGGDGPGPFDPDIGVAPDAHYTAAKAFRMDGTATTADLLEAYQWYASLVGDSGVPVKIINNSWGSNSSYTTVFWNATMTWRDLGIIPVFAIGNTGPAEGTANAPGNYPIVIGVGNTDQNDDLDHSSSRGPAPNLFPWNNTSYWCRGDWNFIKPDISAPGTHILSSIPGGGYAIYSGTSMASPHISGTIALLLSAMPGLDFCDVYNLLLNTAYRPPQGYPYPNNNYGWGRVSAYALIKALSEPFVTIAYYSVETTDSTLDPGDTADIIVGLTNFMDTVAMGAEATLTSVSEYGTVIDSFYTFGDISKNDTISNEGNPFRVFVHDDAPQGEKITLDLHVVANNGDYQTNLYLVLTVHEKRVDYADIITDNADLTVTDNGAIGKYRISGPGSGFIYPLSEGINNLYYASFAASNGTGAYMVDAWYSLSPSADSDWIYTSNPDGRLTYINPVVGDVMAWSKFDDGKFPLGPRGLNITQVAYGYRNTKYGDFVVLQYKAKNEGEAPIDSLYLGIFSDFDVEPYDTNRAGTDPHRKLAYTWNPSHGEAPYVGLALTYPDSLSNLSVIDNPTYVYPGITETQKANFLSGVLSFPSGGDLSDWSVVVSAGPFYLAPQDSQFVIFGFVGGEDSLSLFEHADSLLRVARGPVHVEDPGGEVKEGKPRTFSPFYISVSPTLIGKDAEITYSLPNDSRGEISIYDAAGRRVVTLRSKTLLKGTHRIHWNTSSQRGKPLARGVYFVRLETESGAMTEKVLIIR